MKWCVPKTGGRGCCWLQAVFEMNACVVCSRVGVSRQAAPGEGSCCGGLRFAATALRSHFRVGSLSPDGRGGNTRAKPNDHRCSRKGAFGLGASLRGRRRGAQSVWPRAQRASSSDSPRLFEQSERSERSEFRGGPRDRTRRAVVAPRRPPRRSDAPSPNAPLPPPRSRASSHPSKRKRETPDHGPHRPRPRPRLQGEPATR